MYQPLFVFELAPQVEAALLACHAQGQGTTDYIAMRAAALEVFASGRVPLPAASTAEVTPADTPTRKARAGRRAGRDVVPAGAPA